MRDLRADLDPLWQALSTRPGPRGAHSVMFVAARSGEGTTSMAASFALMAAGHAARSAWLVDTDLADNPAFTGFQQGAFAAAGVPGRAYDASLASPPAYHLIPSEREGLRTRRLAVHQVGETRLLVTRFRSDTLAPGQSAVFRPHPDWWQALRRTTDWIVLDAPAADRSTAGETLAGLVDAVIIVVSAGGAGPDEVNALRADITRRGGRVAGAVLNRMQTRRRR
ncbi:hypothetical protein [Hyphomonas johnsonii]|nr:hypothetical protein [Hyphomonas johnsonii]